MITQIRGSSQIKAGTVDVQRLMADFLKNHTWIVSSADDAVIRGLGAPVQASDAVNKAYADSIKTYADNLIKGLKYKTEVDLIAKSNITLSGTQLIDNVTTPLDSRVAAVGQADPLTNGIWIVKAGAWVRATDMAAGTNAGSSYFFVQRGDAEKDTGWVCANDAGTDVVGSSALTFVKFTSASSYSAGFGIAIDTGNVLKVNTGTLVDNITIEVDGNGKVQVKKINQTHIDFGFGVDQVNAASIPVADIAGITSGSNLQQVLEEMKTLIGAGGGSNPKVTGQVLTCTAGVCQALTVSGQPSISIDANSIQVYYGGLRQVKGAVNAGDPTNRLYWNDYVYNAATRVITFADNTIDSLQSYVVVDFEYQVV